MYANENTIPMRKIKATGTLAAAAFPCDWKELVHAIIPTQVRVSKRPASCGVRSDP